MYGCGTSAVCVQYSQQTVVMAAHQRAGGAQVIPARVPLPAAAHTQMGTVLTAVTDLKKTPAKTTTADWRFLTPRSKPSLTGPPTVCSEVLNARNAAQVLHRGSQLLSWIKTAPISIVVQPLASWLRCVYLLFTGPQKHWGT